MQNDLVSINPKEEIAKITLFIKRTLEKQGFKNAIIAVSGGIDSTTTLSLLRKALEPKQIFVVHLPYFGSLFKTFKQVVLDLKIPEKNLYEISIQPIVDEAARVLRVSKTDKVRFGNIMARIRMVVLYDLAKKNEALVCGTENKSEYYLGYFTRFGDEASDFEPIRHLYKTQVYKLAKYLGVPTKIIKQAPTAGLWPGQTDEEELGFSYREADAALYLYFEKKKSVEEIKKRGFANADKIIEYSKKNNYKHHTPYTS